MIVDKVAILQRKPKEPSRIVGADADVDPSEPSKVWAALVLSIVGLMLISVVFWSGYSFRIETAEVDPAEILELERLRAENPRLSTAWIKASNDYENMKVERDAANLQLEKLTNERDTLKSQMGDSESDKERQDAIAGWIVRLEKFQNSLSNESPRSRVDFTSLSTEFRAFAKTHLSDGEQALLNTSSGLPQYLTARNLEGDQLVMYKLLWRWGLRLNQFMSPVDVRKSGMPF